MNAKNAMLMIQLNSLVAPSCMKIKSDCCLYSFNAFYLYIFVLLKNEKSGSLWSCHALAQRTSTTTAPGLSSEFGRDQESHWGLWPPSRRLLSTFGFKDCHRAKCFDTFFLLLYIKSYTTTLLHTPVNSIVWNSKYRER
jgi:hypothetical protein